MGKHLDKAGPGRGLASMEQTTQILVYTKKKDVWNHDNNPIQKSKK